MRAADADRQEVVDRLRTALEDGRLTMDEYLDRMARAYQAVTYGDLAPLHADLPVAGPADGPATAPAAAPSGPVARVPAGAAGPAPVADQACRGVLAGLPAALRVLWTLWLTAVSVNVVVWALVSGGGGHLAYPWPLWVAGPWGAVLLAQSVAVTHLRRGLPGTVRGH